MVKAVFDDLALPRPRTHVTVGIVDDVTHRSLPFDPDFDIEPDDVVRAVFFGLGSDGTVVEQQEHDQDHRRGDGRLRAGLLRLRQQEVGRDDGVPPAVRPAADPLDLPDLAGARSSPATTRSSSSRSTSSRSRRPGATFLLNTPVPTAEVVGPPAASRCSSTIIERRLRFYAIDGWSVADAAGLGRHVSTVMQTCFFALSGVLPRDEAIVADPQGRPRRRTASAVPRSSSANFAAVDRALAHLHEVEVPAEATATRTPPAPRARPRRRSSCGASRA